MTDEDKAAAVLMSKLEGAKLLSMVICKGDEDHSQHIDLIFEASELRIVYTERGLAAMLYDTQPAGADDKDYHASPGVLQ